MSTDAKRDPKLDAIVYKASLKCLGVTHGVVRAVILEACDQYAASAKEPLEKEISDARAKLRQNVIGGSLLIEVEMLTSERATLLAQLEEVTAERDTFKKESRIVDGIIIKISDALNTKPDTIVEAINAANEAREKAERANAEMRANPNLKSEVL